MESEEPAVVADARAHVPVALKPSIFPARCTVLMCRFWTPQFFCPRFGPVENAAPSDMLKMPPKRTGEAHTGRAVGVQLYGHDLGFPGPKSVLVPVWDQKRNNNPHER